MIHYTCDLCHRQIDTDEEVRYVVKIEMFPAIDAVDATEPQDDRDHLAELHASLEAVHEAEADEFLDPCQVLHFDLCCECRKKFAHHPLGRDVSKLLDISQN